MRASDKNALYLGGDHAAVRQHKSMRAKGIAIARLARALASGPLRHAPHYAPVAFTRARRCRHKRAHET